MKHYFFFSFDDMIAGKLLQNKGSHWGAKFKDYSHHAKKYLISISFDEKQKMTIKSLNWDKKVNENRLLVHMNLRHYLLVF